MGWAGSGRNAQPTSVDVGAGANLRWGHAENLAFLNMGGVGDGPLFVGDWGGFGGV
jgi:hypothetical protein